MTMCVRGAFVLVVLLGMMCNVGAQSNCTADERKKAEECAGDGPAANATAVDICKEAKDKAHCYPPCYCDDEEWGPLYTGSVKLLCPEENIQCGSAMSLLASKLLLTLPALLLVKAHSIVSR